MSAPGTRTLAPVPGPQARPAPAGGRAGAPVFPQGFLWGTATAAHQVEGGNTNNDVWLYEHVRPTMYAESSADACDHFTRYRDDIALLASLGLNLN